MTITASLCPTCYREVEARLLIRDSAVWMHKSCPVHGETTAMVERDALFWRICQQPASGYSQAVYDGISLIEVTDRCNLACRHCYHQPDNQARDRSAAWVVAKAMAAPTATVCLMGAEPTMRDDLPAIVEGVRHGGKVPLIYTNGIRLAERARVAALVAAGLDGVSLSVHDSAYHSPKVFAKVAAALDNVMAAGLALGQVSFTVADLGAGLEEALRTILDMVARGIAPTDFCIRTPAAIGKAFADRRLFVSDVVGAVSDLALARDLAFDLDPAGGSNPYHVRVRFSGTPIQVIHWPDAANLDLRFMNMGPWASFIDGTFGSFALQAILRDGLKKGWWQGQRLSPA
ncbi:MAG: radical SAM protein [Magnetospirillum sp.]|nr:radical SAM protein [Magnetospirillum sp.]